MGRALLKHYWLLCLGAAVMLAVQGYAMVHATEYGDHHFQHEHEHECDHEHNHENERDSHLCVITLYSDRHDDDVLVPAALEIENIAITSDDDSQAYKQYIFILSNAARPRAPPFQA